MHTHTGYRNEYYFKHEANKKQLQKNRFFYKQRQNPRYMVFSEEIICIYFARSQYNNCTSLDFSFDILQVYGDNKRFHI